MDQNPPMQGTQPGNTPQPNLQPTANTAGDTVATEPNVTPVQTLPPVQNPEPTNMPATPAPGAAVTPTPSKKKTGLIVTIIILLVLLLAGVGAAVWFFCFYNAPDNVSFDAVRNFLNAKSVVVDGDSYTDTQYTDGSHQRDVLTIKSNTNDNSGASTIAISGTLYDRDDEEIDRVADLTLGAVAMSDGVLYIKIDNIADMITKVVQANLAYNSSEEASADALAIIDMVELVEGTWWQISVPNIIDELNGEMLDQKAADSVKELYACAVETAKGNLGGELAELYGKHSFIKSEKVAGTKVNNVAAREGSSLYAVNFDYEAMADFINAIPYTDTANKAYDCYNKFYETVVASDEKVSAADFEKVNAADLEQTFGAKFKGQFYLEITDFSHQLTGILMDAKEDNREEQAHFSFTYDKVAVTTPESYRSITELFDDLAKWSYEFSSGSDNIGITVWPNAWTWDEEDEIWADSEDFEFWDDDSDYNWDEDWDDNTLDDEDVWT